jgi:two-component system chemotaxis sensor kinase CheA
MFFEEARELLISLEEGLMDLERRQTDRAHLDKTFRAAHTLKGAAGMVGLPAIMEFTHWIESVLERVRGGQLPVDSDMITTLLESRDHLAAMVEMEAAKSPIPPSGDLIQRLTNLMRGPGGGGGGGGSSSPAGLKDGPEGGGTGPAAPVALPAPAPAAPSSPEKHGATANDGHDDKARAADQVQAPVAKRSASKKTSGHGAKKAGGRGKSAKVSKAMAGTLAPNGPKAGPDSGLQVYRVHLSLGPDTLRRGVNPLGLLDELAELGEAAITTDPSVVPGLDELDPERCYLAWQVDVKTAVDPSRLDEAFLFFDEDCQITVERQTATGEFEVIGRGHQAPSVPPPTAAPLAPTTVQSVPEAPPVQPVGNGIAVAPAVAAKPSNGVATSDPANAAKVAPRPSARIRVDAAQLDELVGLAGELAVLSDNLMGLRELKGIEPWLHALESLQRVSRDIRDTTLDLRMVPVDELFSRFPRVVRDLADRSGKEIELRIIGQETRLDRTIVERLSDPMIHLIRNAVDHALETPQDRLAKGKSRVGRITLSAGHEGDRVAIRVEDDGRGLDRERIVKKGIGLGMIAPGTSADDPRVISLIFEPGFSTRDSVTELSGRGVGLDVVRDAVRALRGSVAVESAPGKGTSFIFRLPLTLALIDGLLVETAGGRYVVPLAQVEECVALNGTRSALAEGRPCVSVRGELVPMVSLRTLFHTNGALPARQELLLTRHAGQRVGVAVDRLLGRVQAVIQSLGDGFHGLNRFSGATILGDGTVSLILDLSALVSESRFAEQSAHSRPRTQ